MILHCHNCSAKSTWKTSVVLRYNVWIMFLDKKKSKTKQVDVYLAVHHVHKNNTPIVFITHGRQSVTRRKLRRQYFLKFHDKILISRLPKSRLTHITQP